MPRKSDGEKNNITSVGITDLVEFCCRTGGLMSQYASGPSAQQGIRAHQRLQKQRPQGSEAEVSLDVLVLEEAVSEEIEGQQFRLRGRVDILHPQIDLHTRYAIEEIKTTFQRPDQIDAGLLERYWSQAKLYAFCYGHQLALEDRSLLPESGEQVLLILHLHQLPVKKSTKLERLCDWSEIESFALDCLREWGRWKRAVDSRQAEIAESARQLCFPFQDYRRGQRTMAKAVYRNIRDHAPGLIEAPTGIGKTMSALFPAIKSLAQGQVDQLVYLTAKTSGRESAKKAISFMLDQGLKLNCLILSARGQTCFCLQKECMQKDNICPYTLDFYHKLPAAREALLKQDMISTDVLQQVAEKLQICPFELGLRMVPWVSLIICDFNYVFDPLVQLSQLMEPGLKRTLLVDEAHNLVERSRDMHSAEINLGQWRSAASLLATTHPGLARAVKNAISVIMRLPLNSGSLRQGAGKHGANSNNIDGRFQEWQVESGQEVCLQRLERCIEKVQLALVESTTEGRETEFSLSVKEWIKSLIRWSVVSRLREPQSHVLLASISDSYTDSSTESISRPDFKSPDLVKHDLLKKNPARTSSGNLILRLRCLDAAPFLAEAYSHFHSVNLFSATLHPQDYYRVSLGFDIDKEKEPPEFRPLTLASPFSEENLGLMICPYIDVRYRQRQASIEPLVELIHRARCSRPGNYLVFFPSYHYLNEVVTEYRYCYGAANLVVQEREATPESREAFLDSFSGSGLTLKKGLSRLGFAVLGGVFGEGVDLVGDSLIGVIIVGVGLSGVSCEQEIRRQQFAERGLPAYDYVYRFPGMTRVLQAAGRVIRSTSDKGIVVLVDQRFNEAFYRRLYPAHWQPEYCATTQQLQLALSRFWER